MNKPIVGVKLPVSGVGLFVAIGVLFAGVIVGKIVGFGVANVPDGVVSNAGPSAAETTKLFVIVCNIPVASLHDSVTEC